MLQFKPRLADQWKKSPHNRNIVGAVLMDLCKALNYLPRDLLVARLCVYDLPIHVVIFFYTHTYGKKTGCIN